MKKEFTLAFNEVLDSKQLPPEVVIEAIESAMISAYRKAVNASSAQQVVAKIDLEDGGIKILAEKEVVDEVHDERTEVAIDEARGYVPEIEVGDMLLVESTPHDFGRVAAQTARQVIQQRIREAEREEQFKYYSVQVGDIVNGVVQAINNRAVTLGLDKRAEGQMPYKEQIRGERFRLHDRVRALLLEVNMSPRGPQILLSRSHKKFLRRLLEDEVPEIYTGQVEIRSISREPGHRSKVAVSAVQPGIDPVGACVGVRGVRIQAIVRELHDEKIDVIEWNADPGEFIAKALSPARVLGVFLDRYTKGTKTATVVVPEDQLSLAIGRDGQNARLAAKLTGWRIDIKSIPEAAGDSMHRLQEDPEYAFLVESESEVMVTVENILAKKAEGRPVPPEDYTVLSKFITRVENRVLDQRAEIRKEEQEKKAELRATVPPVAFNIPLEEIGLSSRHSTLLGGAGYTSAGDLLFQMRLDSDAVLALNGIGPKAMEKFQEALEQFLENLPEPEEEEPQATEDGAPAEGEAPASEAVDAAAPADEPFAAEVETAAEGAGEEPEAEAPVEAEPVPEAEGGGDIAAETGPETGIKPEPAAAEIGMPVKDGMGEKDFDDLFSFTPEDFGIAVEEEEEEPDVTEDKKKKKKKKRPRYSEMEYDPDLDITIVRRKRKRGGKDEWLEDDWE